MECTLDIPSKDNKNIIYGIRHKHRSIANFQVMRFRRNSEHYLIIHRTKSSNHEYQIDIAHELKEAREKAHKYALSFLEMKLKQEYDDVDETED